MDKDTAVKGNLIVRRISELEKKRRILKERFDSGKTLFIIGQRGQGSHSGYDICEDMDEKFKTIVEHEKNSLFRTVIAILDDQIHSLEEELKNLH